MAKVALALAALFAVLALLSWLLRAPPANVARLLRRLFFVAVIALLAWFAATGRLHWLFVVLGTLFAFLPRLLPYLPILGGLYKRYRAAQAATRGSPSGSVSQVETRYVRMRLDHASGEIDGMVIDGRFSGARLSELPVDQLIELLHECRLNDEESAQLVQAYLDNVHGEAWRERAGAAGADTREDAGAGHSQAPPAGGAMTPDEAREILGLPPGADREAIIAAHRRLMQKLHPDRGGSSYLSAKINQARDVLLG